jgi:hypothetical protein
MIDAWTGRTPQSTEFPKTEADGVKKLLDVIKRQGVELGEKTSNLFRTAGITIGETLMTFGNNVRVEGTLTSTGAASLGGSTTVTGTLTTTGPANIDGAMTVGGTMNVTGDATFSGNLAVPNGSITNAALASPLSIVGATPVTSGGWAVSTVAEAKASSGITVPAGFSRATVVAWANMHFMDSSPNGGWVRATIAGNAGAEMGGLANLQLGQSATHALGLTGLSGGTITVSCDVRASVGTGGMSGRIAQINAVAFFQR